uniref:Transposase n=1 Tax=Steinernema glaseri TaxID=37863 RepID=A0A1I7ZKY2_9BILA
MFAADAQGVRAVFVRDSSRMCHGYRDICMQQHVFPRNGVRKVLAKARARQQCALHSAQLRVKVSARQRLCRLRTASPAHLSWHALHPYLPLPRPNEALPNCEVQDNFALVHMAHAALHTLIMITLWWFMVASNSPLRAEVEWGRKEGSIAISALLHNIVEVRLSQSAHRTHRKDVISRAWTHLLMR